MSIHTEAWVELAQTLGERAFLRRHPGFFLMSSSESSELSSLYGTQIDSGPIRLSRRKFEVRWIHRSHESENPQRITVGRAGNCDVSFRHPSVSKLHAYFSVDGDRLTLTDLQSRNGSRVNGELIAANRPAPVAPHDGVQFGAVQSMVLEGRELFEVLGRMS